jgi:hypothetical protein
MQIEAQMIHKWNHEVYTFTWLMLAQTCDESSIFFTQHILYIIIRISSKLYRIFKFLMPFFFNYEYSYFMVS